MNNIIDEIAVVTVFDNCFVSWCPSVEMRELNCNTENLVNYVIQ